MKRDRTGLGGSTKEKAQVTHFNPLASQLKQKIRNTTSSRRKREAALSREHRKERVLRRELGDMLTS
jgi:hypothetical protein